MHVHTHYDQAKSSQLDGMTNDLSMETELVADLPWPKPKKQTPAEARAAKLGESDSEEESTDYESCGEEADSEQELDGGVRHSAKEMLGWKCTYRLSRPEVPQKSKVLQKLMKKTAAFLPVLKSLPEAGRVHKSIEKSGASEKVKQRKKDFLEKMREFRRAHKATKKGEIGVLP